MSVQLTDELQQVRGLAREFAASELRPDVERRDRERTLDAAILGQLAELGFFGMLVPEENGGMGFDLPTYAAALEELAWGEPAVAFLVGVHSAHVAGLLLERGTDAQKERWLGPLAAGEVIGCVALPDLEAGSGAEPGLTATATGDGWLLEGSKSRVVNPRIAGVAALLARAEGGTALFLVPTDAPGIEVGDREATMGLRSLEIATVRLRGVRLGPDALVGPATAGIAALGSVRDLGRIGIAAQAAGIARAALEHAIAYAGEREQFGTRLRDFEGMQFKLAEMAARVEAARALVERAAAEPSTRAAAAAKLFAGRTAMQVATDAVQVFGGYGYMRDYPVEKLMRDAKAMEIYGGTNETLRVAIARELYRP